VVDVGTVGGTIRVGDVDDDGDEAVLLAGSVAAGKTSLRADAGEAFIFVHCEAGRMSETRTWKGMRVEYKTTARDSTSVD
jgi:hypothetical protein